MQVSHETIYRSLFVQSRGVLKKALLQHLRRRRTMRRSQHAANRGQRRGQIVDAVSIRERPAAIEDRAIPGHWEGDLLAGASNSHVVTLVERHSRYVMLARVPGKDTSSVVRALSRHVRTLPRGLMASLTWDRGAELAAHKRFTLATDVQVYFCDPQSPWQRGSNENTNGLLRQYFPKGVDLSAFSQPDLNRIARRLNQRPRKTLGYHTPADRLATIGDQPPTPNLKANLEPRTPNLQANLPRFGSWELALGADLRGRSSAPQSYASISFVTRPLETPCRTTYGCISGLRNR